MLWLLALLAFAQPDECTDRSPGLSKCVEYEPPKDGKVKCRAACHHGRRPDGGTYGTNVYAEGKDKAACLFELQRQATNGCKPVEARKR
jgi:hypothetical protein